MLVDDVKWVKVCGYEVPATICKLTRRLLGRLKRDGVIHVEHDDGDGVIAHAELKEIAGAIGLYFYEDGPYWFVVIDPYGSVRRVSC